jgi:uncharacterized protein YfiM (DUF2279 family)
MTGKTMTRAFAAAAMLSGALMAAAQAQEIRGNFPWATCSST